MVRPAKPKSTFSPAVGVIAMDEHACPISKKPMPGSNTRPCTSKTLIHTLLQGSQTPSSEYMKKWRCTRVAACM